VQRANYREIPLIIETAKSAGVNRISFLTVDISNVFAFGPRFTADASLNIASSTAVSLVAIANAGPGSPPEHGPVAAALTPDDLSELTRILDEVEIRFKDDFASGLLVESPEKLRRMVAYFGALHGVEEFPRPRCNAPHLNLVIEVDGTLRPCFFLPGFGEIEAGTRHISSLHDLINNPDALALRKAYRTGQRPECERCVCPLYKGPRALMQL
jgi:radical SAM protein with 4Fe4S-binding SPASM domain